MSVIYGKSMSESINTIFKFNEEKTTQIVAYIMQQEGVDMAKYTKILKLLYLLDKKWIEDTSEPITGDIYCSMHLGPVLSKTYNLMKGQKSNYWSNYIARNPEGDDTFSLNLLKDPGKSKLNKALIRIIDELIIKYKNYTYQRMVNELHTIVPEWEDPYKYEKKSLPLERSTIYEKLKFDKSRIDVTISREKARQNILLGR
jgi:uncharacterized phage-associated protein